MKIALVTAEFRNGDMDFNLEQAEKNMRRAKAEGAGLACFGEAFLQGFDGFSWDYEHDKNIGVSVQDRVFLHLLALTKEIGVDLLIGFLERNGEELYSSCALHRLFPAGRKGFWWLTCSAKTRKSTQSPCTQYNGKGVFAPSRP